MRRPVNARQISFGEIEVGDRLRVRHSVGGNARGQHVASYGPVSSVTRTLVAEVAVRPLETVWLSADGHTVVHSGWDDLEILRLSGEAREVVSRRGLPWTAEEDLAVRDWTRTDRMVSAQLGRTYAAVCGRRSMLRRGVLVSSGAN